MKTSLHLLVYTCAYVDLGASLKQGNRKTVNTKLTYIFFFVFTGGSYVWPKENSQNIVYYFNSASARVFWVEFSIEDFRDEALIHFIMQFRTTPFREDKWSGRFVKEWVLFLQNILRIRDRLITCKLMIFWRVEK